ncbi:hypothetical protein WJX74_007063 [Apatococcus lobatus]|uniref:Uncharacterized protein n=1 Tax=Apatococcus lobatus TaxID=904363 RepID=A0AAW1RJE4_9CHLO
MGGRGRGRGWYYKQRYGGGGKGGGGGDLGDGGSFGESTSGPAHLQPDRDDHDQIGNSPSGEGHIRGSVSNLRAALQQIHGKGYKAYHDIKGRWQGLGFVLCVDRVQGDPFAAPSCCRVQVPGHIAAFPSQLWQDKIRRTALCDYLTRTFAGIVSAAGGDTQQQAGGWHGEKGGDMQVDMPGQHVLERTSILINGQGDVEARFTVGLPARGRSVLGDWAANILTADLPRYVKQGLHWASQDAAALRMHLDCVEDTQSLRDALPGLGLVSFVGDGAVLPRASGASDCPMPARQAVPFKSPINLSVEMSLPNRGLVRGLGVKSGVTLIVGGGFHGKTTLLRAIEAGIYNKIPGDGRELVVTDPNAIKVRAEDGRRVEAVDISPFINNLPYGRSTTCFSSDDASGSTSQSANIQEALEVRATTLLVDEDTCATNFMIRDARMQALVAKEKEPITPFLSKIKALADLKVSCILVIGGSGDYFSVAGTVLCMEDFACRDVTADAHLIAQQFGDIPALQEAPPYGRIAARTPYSIHPPSEDSRGRGIKVSTKTIHTISYGSIELDLNGVEQLAEKSQTRAVAFALQLIASQLAARHGRNILQLIEQIDASIDDQGLDILSPQLKCCDLARPRRFEIAAALNRLRTVKLKQ